MIVETILGALTGILGPVIGGYFKLGHAKLELQILTQKNSHEVLMVKAQTEAMIKEAEANIKIIQTQVEGAIELKDAEAYIKSQEVGNANIFGNKWVDALLAIEGKWRVLTIPTATIIAFLFGLVDFIKGLTRPALTAYLCGCTTWITMLAWKIMKAQSTPLTNAQAVAIFSDVTAIVTYLTVSSVTWWFGDRMMSKYIMAKQGVDRKKDLDASSVDI